MLKRDINMVFISLIVVTGLASLARQVLAENCQNSPGVANGECVKFYSSSNCNGNPEGSFKPDCSGHCFQFSSFGSIGVGGGKFPVPSSPQLNTVSESVS